MSDDVVFMMCALELARRGEGLTRPNPPVGAVLVRDGKVLAEGWHEKAGGPHAEAVCLDAWSREPGAGSLESATLYITLEPCSTRGRTPPCTDLILERGIGRVVVSVEDRNPKHAGRGLDILRKAGVQVVTGVCEEEGRELIAPFEQFITSGMPYVTLKLASTLDGRIADRTGLSKWITGPEARERVQAMRRRADAVMVGDATVRADDPSLLPRPDEGREPWRIVIGDDIPSDAKVLTDEAKERTLVMDMKGCTDVGELSRAACDRATGPAPLQIGSLKEGMKKLATEYDVMHVLCEGGGRLAGALVEESLVDEFAFFIAPKLLGADGVPNYAKTGGLIGDCRRLRIKSVEQIGEDLLVKAVMKP